MTASLSRRLLTLLVVLSAGLGLIYALPSAPKPPAPGVATVLPDFVDEWYGQDAAVTEKERQVLGAETTFARKQYTNGRGASIFVSIVFSGEDMSASIHRPERCLPAQGFTLVDSRTEKLPLSLDPTHPLTVTRLHTLRPIYDAQGRPVTYSDGRPFKDFSLVYYWFIGSKETTASHTERYLLDTRDRIWMGTNQRWAYVSVMSRITANVDKFGLDEPQTDELVQTFIRKLTPLIQAKSVVIR